MDGLTVAGRDTKTTTPSARAPSAGENGDTPRPRRDPAPAIKIRAHDGRIHLRALPAERHRRLHLGLLHAASDGYVEIAAGRRPAGGKLALTSRRDRGTFLPGGASGQIGWLDDLLAHADCQIVAGKEVCVGPAVRRERAASKRAVSHTNWLWLDVDGADGLPALRALLRRRPAHLVIESAGSGGAHAYWRLQAPLQAGADERLAWLTGEGDDAIERAHERIIYALGYRWQQGRPIATVADPNCRDRSRVMRLAGTINGKTGAHARIIWADLALAPWALRALIGDLPAPPTARPTTRRAATASAHRDPYKQIAPPDYFQRLAGIDVPDHGLVSCPNPAHSDTTPSCHVGRDASEGWCCHGCQARGAIYDLASVLLGGPTGRWLRGDRFERASVLVREAFGELSGRRRSAR